jgi:hypothetical protein
MSVGLALFLLGFAVLGYSAARSVRQLSRPGRLGVGYRAYLLLPRAYGALVRQRTESK